MKLSDLMAAEKALDGALEELRAYSRNPDAWSAHERLDNADKRVLVIHRGHFEYLETLQGKVAAAENRLRALQQSFAGGPQ